MPRGKTVDIPLSKLRSTTFHLAFAFGILTATSPLEQAPAYKRWVPVYRTLGGETALNKEAFNVAQYLFCDITPQKTAKVKINLCWKDQIHSEQGEELV